MIIPPTSIEQDGPGIDLSSQPTGIMIEMSDPVADFEYARNGVTLTYHLFGALNVRLGFAAMEFGMSRTIRGIRSAWRTGERGGVRTGGGFRF